MKIEPAIPIEDLPACVVGDSTPIGPMTVAQYFRMPETNQHEELVFGWLVREATPASAHQLAISAITHALIDYVTARDLGVAYGPVCDVVLDEAKRLVVEPDAMVVLKDRVNLRKGRLYTAPNIAIEVLSRRTATRDRTVKLEWYRTYGVQEYWIVDVKKKLIEVRDLTAQLEPTVVTYREGDTLRSHVLPEFTLPVSDVFDYAFRYI